MSETSKEAGAILFAALKWPLMIGGLIAAFTGIIGSTFGQMAGGGMALGVGGIAALILGIAFQSLDRSSLARRYNRWATEAAEGYGPVIPSFMQQELVRQILLRDGVRADLQGTFKAACRDLSTRASGRSF